MGSLGHFPSQWCQAPEAGREPAGFRQPAIKLLIFRMPAYNPTIIMNRIHLPEPEAR